VEAVAVVAKLVEAVVLAVIEQPLKLHLQLQQTTQLQLVQVALSDQRPLLVAMAVPAPVPYSQQLLQLVVVTVAVLVQVKLVQMAALAVPAVRQEVITPKQVALEIRQVQVHLKVMLEQIQLVMDHSHQVYIPAAVVAQEPQVLLAD
jgi:hypothetical protein